MKRFAAAALVSILIPACSFAETVTIAGDPCSVPLISKLAQAYSARNRDFKAEVSSFSCTLGVYKAADGEFDIGVSTQNGLSSNPPKGAVNTVVAKSPIVLIVNRNNPVNGLAYSELKGIFSGKIRNWKEVGGVDREIKNVMLEPCVRHTIQKQVVIYGDTLNLTPAGKVNPVEFTNRLVSADQSAMGQQIYGYESEDVKVLRIDGMLPQDSTPAGRYGFYQDFNIVTKGEPEGVVRDFIGFASSDEGGRIIKALSHVPSTGALY